MANIRIGHGVVIMQFPDGTGEEKDITDVYRVEDAFNDFISRFQVDGEYAHYCGLYGYTTFNAVSYFENIPIKDSRITKNDAPDIFYILYKYLVVFNDFKSEMVLVEMCSPDEPSHIQEIEKIINNRNFTEYEFHAVGETSSTLTDEQHRMNIRKGIRHCLRGDTFQVVLSRRFIQRYEGDDFKLYRALRSINPSPYLFYFDFGGFRIFGSSPETHCKIENGVASIDPIAGTVRRNGNKEKDMELAKALLADPKENAEHIMLVDLARNDLSRNCKHVKVEFFKKVIRLYNCYRTLNAVVNLFKIHQMPSEYFSFQQEH